MDAVLSALMRKMPKIQYYLPACFRGPKLPSPAEFIAESIKYIPRVRVSVVDIPEVDIEACREIADRMGMWL